MKFPHHVEPLEARIAPAFAASTDVSHLSGHNGFAITHFPITSYLGISVHDAGDVNGDGFADVIVSSQGVDFYQTDGAAYVIFGKAGGFPPSIDLKKLNGHNGFELVRTPPAGEYSSIVSISGAGDVNGDGFADLIVGSNVGNFGYNYDSAVSVVFGKAGGFAPTIELNALNGRSGFKIVQGDPADGHPLSVSEAGDINGDGFADVVIGGTTGVGYVVFGHGGRFAASLNLADLDGHTGFAFVPEAHANNSLVSVSGAGDLNGDGLADLVIGTFQDDPAGFRSGSAYAVYGKTGGLNASLDLSTLDGSNGFKMNGVAAGDWTGFAVSGAGDINGDGFSDLIVGAFGAPNYGYQGAAYVVFGKPSGGAAQLDLANLDGANGFKLSGVAANDEAGFSVSGAGDINGDGFADLVVGAPHAGRSHQSYEPAYAGAAYVVFGKADGFGANLDLATLDGHNGFNLHDDGYSGEIGHSVSRAGDINGDGFADVLVASDRGAYVVFGRDTGGLRLMPDGHAATYTDPDGDLVTVKTSRGKLTNAMFDLRADGLGFQLEKLDLSDPAFAGAKITFTAVPQNVDGLPGKEGNGHANVGYLDATGVDLGQVIVHGDLGQIDAGNRSIPGAAIKLLQVQSLGAFGPATQDSTAPSLHSDLDGDLNMFVVAYDIGSGETLAIAGKLGAASIGGNLDGATLSVLGTLAPAKHTDALAIASLTIGGHVADSQILVGYDLTGAAMNPDVDIGSVIVGGSWSASSLAVGVADCTHDGFGQNDTLIPGASDLIVASIASITIKGPVTGGAASGDFFGITAERIKQAKINHTILALTANQDDFLLDATNDDFRLVEV